GFADGGVLPGYSPGKDNMIGMSKWGPVGLSGGEGILRPEVMRVPGMKDFLYAANRRARVGGIHGVQNMIKDTPVSASRRDDPWNKKFPGNPGPKLGFAKGGVFDMGGGRSMPLAAHFDIGDVFEKAKDIVGKVTSLSPASLITRGIKFTEDWI